MKNDLTSIAISALDALPNPVLIKDHETRYVWINAAFEQMFSVELEHVIGELDIDLFPHRQVAQCNGGDLRVLETGLLNESDETVFDPLLGPREVMTRKSRVVIDGEPHLVGILHDITSLNERNRELSGLTKRLTDQRSELERLATTDPLTACANRRVLFDSTNALLKSHSTIGMVSIDVDNFKSINDKYGHAAGDALLVAFSELARSAIRQDDIVARVGGDEFSILLPGASVDDTNRAAERIRKLAAETPVLSNGQQIEYTVSVGVAHCQESSDVTVASLLREADIGLYTAKDAGRNQVHPAS